MVSELNDPSMSADSVDFGLVLAIARRGWKTIAVGILAALIAASLFLHLATYRYTATLVVSPAETSGMDALSSKLGSIGGLAAAAGVSLGDGGGTDFRLYVEGLKSSDTAADLARDPEILKHIFHKEWNESAGRFVAPTGPVRDVGNAVKTVMGIPKYPYSPPDAKRLQKILDEHLLVDSNARSPVVTIKFADEDPDFAVRFLTEIDRIVDGRLRARALERSSLYIAHLTEVMARTTTNEQRYALAQAIVQQERVRISASSELPFAAQVFSGPSSTFRPTSPKPAVVLAVALALGALGSFALLFLREKRRAFRPTESSGG